MLASRLFNVFDFFINQIGKVAPQKYFTATGSVSTSWPKLLLKNLSAYTCRSQLKQARGYLNPIPLFQYVP